MMLTQRISALAHDLARQCQVNSVQVEEKTGTPRGARESSHRYSRNRRRTRQSVALMERSLLEHYELGDVIGEGGFGSVCAGTSRHTGQTVAIKIVHKSKVFSWAKVGQQVVPKEVALLHCLNHKYIIKMLDYFEDHDNFYIVMERPEKYIDLFDYISGKRAMSERSARFLFRQIVEAVQYCTSVGVLHRDVKDENILIDLKTSQIKLIDFGSGTFLRDGVYTEYEGTKVYAPPEWVLRHQYQAVPATVWSLGILLYDMLLGDVPFETEAQIVAGYLDFHVQLTPEARSLIQWMLSFRPQERPTLEQIADHPWLKTHRGAHHATPTSSPSSSPSQAPRCEHTSPQSSVQQSHSYFTPPLPRACSKLAGTKPPSSHPPPGLASPSLPRKGLPTPSLQHQHHQHQHRQGFVYTRSGVRGPLGRPAGGEQWQVASEGSRTPLRSGHKYVFQARKM